MKKIDRRKPDKWVSLMRFIQNYADAQEANSWKGGGDPADVPVIEAQLQLAKAQLEQFIEILRRDES